MENPTSEAINELISHRLADYLLLYKRNKAKRKEVNFDLVWVDYACRVRVDLSTSNKKTYITVMKIETGTGKREYLLQEYGLPEESEITMLVSPLQNNTHTGKLSTEDYSYFFMGLLSGSREPTQKKSKKELKNKDNTGELDGEVIKINHTP